MLKRNCVCGKPIPYNRQLCASCIIEYGSPDKWEEWLTDWMKNYKRELDSENLHRHLTIDVDGEIVEPAPYFKLRGCRTETHERTH